MKIKNKITVSEERFGNDDLSISDIIKYYENEYQDTTVFFDVSLESLIDELHYNGIDDKLILERNKALYGAYIEFIYIPNFNIYIMLYGIR